MMASPGVASVMMDAAQALLLQQGKATAVSSTSTSSQFSPRQGQQPNPASTPCVTATDQAPPPMVVEGRGRTVSAEAELMETDAMPHSSSAQHSNSNSGASCAAAAGTIPKTPPAGVTGDFASSDALDALAALASATSEVRNASVDEEDADEDEDGYHEEERRDTLSPLIASRSPSPEQAKSSRSSGTASSSSRPRAMMGRLRSVSNPEGMEKWDSMGSHGHGANPHRRHFVLPTSILEEELADAQMAVDRGIGRRYRACSSNGQFGDDPHHHPYADDEPDYMDAAPLRISPDVSAEATIEETDEYEEDDDEEGSGDEEESSGDEKASSDGDEDEENAEEEEEEDTSNLTPNELLRRARARLLEDVSTANGGPAGTSVASRGVLPLPHSLGKYKNVYNKNGRIGIYTPSERAAIIARFQSKRARRNWKKKIRYGCRKNLADRRVRVKGRFVKRDFVPPSLSPTPSSTPPGGQGGGEEQPSSQQESSSQPNTAWNQTKGGEALAAEEGRSVECSKKAVEFAADAEMTDADASGSSSGPEEPVYDQPTEEQPYRRTRRHTFA